MGVPWVLRTTTWKRRVVIVLYCHLSCPLLTVIGEVNCDSWVTEIISNMRLFEEDQEIL